VAAFMGLGEIQVLMQKPQDGAANLEKALALNPELKEVHQFLGNAYEASREWAKACAAYEKFIGFGPANVWMIYQRLGTCRFEAGEFDAAAAAFGEALKAQPEDQMLNYRLAQSLERAAKYEQAEAVYLRLAGLSPKDAMNYNRAVFQMYDKANVTAKAVEAGKKVIQLNPADEQSHYNLGIVYQKAQRLTEAIDSFKKAAEIKPAWEMAHFQIGYCYYTLKRYTEAIPHFKKNVEVAPDNFYGYLYIGMCYMQGKQFTQAMDPMKKAVDLKPGDGTALFNMGIIYLNLRDKYSALEVAKKLQEIDPNLGNRLRSYIK
jgi:tetratricopeptide (TPR) repeat protein